MADNRDRVFATVVYPESAPADWMDRLNEFHIPALVSPLHDEDVNPDGEIKKPHYHVVLLFDGKKNFDTQVKPLFDEIGGVGRERIISTRGYVRYLTHMDNPEKVQYNPNDVISFGGVNYDLYCMSPTDEHEALKEMQKFIRVNQIFSFSDFADYCAEHNEVWYKLLTDKKTYYFTKYIKSLSYTMTDDKLVSRKILMKGDDEK